jgi:hypothetical protein
LLPAARSVANISERAVESQDASVRSDAFLSPRTARVRRTGIVLVALGTTAGRGVAAGLAVQA